MSEWGEIALKFLLAFVLLILAASLSMCNNESARTRCEERGGQYIQNDYHSERSACVMPRRWN